MDYKNLVILIMLFSFTNLVAESQRRIDSLRQLLENNEVDQSNLAFQLFLEYRLNNLDSAMFFALQSNELAKAKGDSLLMTKSVFALGWAYQRQGFYSKAISSYLEALSIAQNNGYHEREKNILNNLGLANYYQGNYDDALIFHFKSLNLREEDGNKGEIAVSSNNIGLVYYRVQDYSRAIEYFKKSLSLKESIGTTAKIESTLINLGLCYSGLDMFDEAIQYFDRVLEICENGCSEAIKIDTYGSAGIAYYDTKNLEKAENYFSKSVELARSTDFKNYLVVNLHYLAKIRFDQGQFQEALIPLNESQQVALELDYRTWIRDNYKLYGKIYAESTDYRLAYEYQNKYDSLNQNILNEEVITNLANIQANYQERENLQTIESQDQEISRRNTLLSLSAIIIFLTTSIVFMLYRVSRLRKRTNRQLAEAKSTIERQNNVLEEKVRERTKELKGANAALMKSNTDLDNFIYKTSHDIRGPLATLQGMCNVAIMDINDKKSLDYFEKIGRTASRLNEILSKLLIINQINNSLITTNDIDLASVVGEIVGQQAKMVKGCDIKVDNRIGNLNHFKSDEILVKIILNNLISNAYKFHNSSNRVESWIRLEAVRENGHLEFSVIDNGIGVDENASSKIFEIFSKASEVSDSAGLGLYLVKLAVEKLNGHINHSKTSDGHTKFTVELPLNG